MNYKNKKFYFYLAGVRIFLEDDAVLLVKSSRPPFVDQTNVNPGHGTSVP